LASEKAGKENEKTKRVLFFRSGQERFAVDVLSVEEVVVGMEWTPVPLAPQSVAGVINHRGRIFTILDFAGFCKLDGKGEEGGSAVLLHRSDMSVGVAVSAVEGIERVPEARLENLGDESGEHAQPFMQGLLDFKGGMATLLDVEKLVDVIAHLADGTQAGAVDWE